MPKSSRLLATRKPSKPAKPYEGYPLFAHASGRWAKKILQKLRFYGRWATTVKGVIVPVEDVDASAAEALAEFNRCWPHHKEGREAPPKDAPAGCTIRDLCNSFLTTKLGAVEDGELSQYSFSEYQRTTDAIMAHFGRDRRVDDLKPLDFEGFRRSLSKDVGPVTAKSKINRARVVFKYASDNLLIDRPVAYGKSFDRPKAKQLRKARNEAGERLFERDDLLRILELLDGKSVMVEGQDKPAKIPASAVMKAMILLALNGGLGNTDISSLPRSAVDLESGWMTYPRIKTEVPRRIPLWPETVATLRQALAERTTPKDDADSDLCFITERGTRFVRLQKSSTEGRFVTINSLSRRFESIMAKLDIKGRRGLNFYAMRHVFETQAGECRDQVAVNAIMGHVDASMAGEYRERISDERLRAVVEQVHEWLWPAEQSSATTPQESE